MDGRCGLRSVAPSDEGMYPPQRSSSRPGVSPDYNRYGEQLEWLRLELICDGSKTNRPPLRIPVEAVAGARWQGFRGRGKLCGRGS